MKKRINAKKVLTLSNRLDIWAKYLYAYEFIHTGNVSNVSIRVYLESLAAMNGFVEISPPKNSKQEFLDSFDNLIKSIVETGFLDMENDPVILNKSFDVISGAHRIAVCAVLGIDIHFEESETQEYKFSYDQFRKAAFPAQCEFELFDKLIEIGEEIRALIVFPVSSLQEHDLGMILAKIPHLYAKNSDCNLNLLETIRYLNYSDIALTGRLPDWIPSHASRSKEIINHASLSNGDGKFHLVLFTDFENILDVKRELRLAIGKGNYSVHSTETNFETLMIIRQIIHPESKAFAMQHGMRLDEYLFSRLTQIRSFFSDNSLFHKDILFIGSTVMALHGIRPNMDFDVMVRNTAQSQYLTQHCNMVNVSPESDYTEFIRGFTSPDQHFFYLGLKFLGLKEVMLAKRVRDENRKDSTDIKAISNHLEICPRNDLSFFVKKFQTISAIIGRGILRKKLQFIRLLKKHPLVFHIVKKLKEKI